MQDRLLRAASATARFVFVVVAFGLAIGSIGISASRGFCPEVAGQAMAMPALATIVEPEDTTVDDAPAEDSPAEDGPGGGDGGQGTTEAPAEEVPADGGECPGGAPRCLPPLWSSFLLLGEPECHDQAGPRLRGTLVPAFVGATVLFAGAWWLRPTRLHGDPDQQSTPADTAG